MIKDGLLTRRRAIATIGAAGTLLLPGHRLLAGDTSSSDIASGTVFEDRNGDGRRVEGAGIAGVMVSNGLEVTVTDGDGHWSLPGNLIICMRSLLFLFYTMNIVLCKCDDKVHIRN